MEAIMDGDVKKEELLPAEDLGQASESVKSLASQMNELAVSANPVVVAPATDSTEASDLGASIQDTDKRIRALKKKVYLIIPSAFPVPW